MTHVVDRLSLTGAPTAAIPHPNSTYDADTVTPSSTHTTTTTTTTRTPNNTTIERTGTSASLASDSRARASTSASSSSVSSNSANSATAPAPAPAPAPSSHDVAPAAAAPAHVQDHRHQHHQEHQPLVDDLLALYSYQQQPAAAAFARYAPDATFRDPVSVAHGRAGIETLFTRMGKLFAESRTEDYHVLDGTTPQELHLDLTQKYVFKSSIPLKEKGSSRSVTSKIALKLDPRDGKIVEHIEEWIHEPSDDGFFGKVQKFRKKMDAELVESTVTSDA